MPFGLALRTIVLKAFKFWGAGSGSFLRNYQIIFLLGSSLAAGYDLYSAYDYEIPAYGKLIAKTDIQIRVPDGTYGRIAPRSGLAAKHFIDIGAGVVDQDYR